MKGQSSLKQWNKRLKLVKSNIPIANIFCRNISNEDFFFNFIKCYFMCHTWRKDELIQESKPISDIYFHIWCSETHSWTYFLASFGCECVCTPTRLSPMLCSVCLGCNYQQRKCPYSYLLINPEPGPSPGQSTYSSSCQRLHYGD